MGFRWTTCKPYLLDCYQVRWRGRFQRKHRLAGAWKPETQPPAALPVFLSPPDDAGVQYEFFAPFAHVPGRYEWCRIRSPSHGAFDCLILLGASTAVAATVYVGDDNGARFMADRYPECTTFRGRVRLTDSRDGRVVRGRMRAKAGPLRSARMTLHVASDAKPRQVAYGGTGDPVWGSRWTCWGVDLTLDARAAGVLRWRDGRRETLRGEPAFVTMGSFGRLASRS